MKFFHRTTDENAASILKTGFRDATGYYMFPTPMTGVWVSDVILDEQSGAGGEAVFEIELEISNADSDYYEVRGEGPYREWHIPSALLNKGIIKQLSPEEISAILDPPPNT
jgi:hypothetical protein